MKNFIKKVVFFLLFFALFTIVLNSAYLVLIAKTDWDFIKRLESLKFEDPDYELLVLGASLAQYDIDTECLTNEGIKSFNLSMVGSSVKTCYIQLEEYLSRYNKTPDYVILGVNSYLESFHQEGIQPVVEFTMEGHKYGIKDVPITKFHWAYLELLKKIMRPEYRKTYVTYGHKKTQRVMPDNTQNNNIYIDKNKFESAKWIGKMAELCQLNEIEFIVIDLPGERKTQNLSDIGPYVLYMNNGYFAKLYNFNNRDFCKFIDDKKDWAGMSHLNKKGAKKFTREILKYDLFN